MSIYEYLAPAAKGYIVKSAIYYYSKRFDKSIKINEGFESDGATFYFDLDSLFWVVHDYLKVKRKWQDGSHCSNWQASLVAFDILMNENRYIHAPVVFTGTLVYGYIKQLFKGLR